MPTTQKPPSAPQRVSLKELNANLSQEVMELKREHDESLAREAATSEILRMIAKSPADIQSVLDTIAENSARLCGADDAVIRRVEGDSHIAVAHFGSIRLVHEIGVAIPIELGGFAGRAVRGARTLHVHDLRDAEAEFPGASEGGVAVGVRTALAVPFLKDGKLLGIIHIRRLKVQPFTEQQIRLVETFADQAVIAIENVRLFKELGERNAELREALEHQTATAEVLGIISRSPTDVQPVLDAIVESAARVCGVDDMQLRLREGDTLISRAHFGPIPIGRVISIDEPQVRWIREHGTLHVTDARAAQTEFPCLGVPSGFRSYLSAPLCLHEEFVGDLEARRLEVRPFTPAQIKLLETFADQAVIAIENVRLFQELKESLEQQTATSEILGVIASSPTDIQPVLDVIAENAARLCDASDALIFRVNGNFHERVARYGLMPVLENTSNSTSRDSPAGRAILDRETIHVHDLAASEADFPDAQTRSVAMGVRTALSTPLLREGVSIGAIHVRRKEVRPFSNREIRLLETFASQAVIAIENVRLFKELQERNAELREALEHQTATAEVLGIISRSPTDVQPVLDAIVESAAKVCGVDDVLLRLQEGNAIIPRAHFGSIPVGRVEVSIDEPQYRWMREHGALHIPDVRAQDDFPMMGSLGNFRSILSAPLCQQGELIGVLT